LQMKMPVAQEGDSNMQMTGRLGQHLCPPQPDFQDLLVLLGGTVLGAKEEVAVPATTRAGAGVRGRLLASRLHPFLLSSP
jgi:hypothetical protein